METPLARRLAAVAAALLSLWAVAAARAQATVDLSVQTDRPYVGESLLVKLRVSNFEDYRRPQFPELPGCTIQFLGQSSGSEIRSFGGGRPQVQKHATLSYTLIPYEPGKLTIPAIPVVVDGKTLKTEPYSLTVRELPESPQPPGDGRSTVTGEPDTLLLAEITCAHPRLYVGQRATFTLTIWLKPAAYGRRPLRTSEMLRCVTGNFGPFDTSAVGANRIERTGNDGSAELWDVIELPAELTIQQAGPVSFDDVVVGVNYPTRFSRDIFGDLRVAADRKLRVRPTVTVPDAQPLPTESRPAGFSGALGQYAISVMAVPTNVRVGDPIELTIDISGNPIDAVPAPDLTAIPELVEGFRVPGERLAGTVSGNRKTFTQTIRARQPDVKEIPPVEFAFFDPQRGAYQVARSEPIPILVRAVEELDAADLTNIAAEPATAQPDSVEVRDALRGIKTGESELLAHVHPVTLPQLALTTAAGPLLFIGVLGLSALRRTRRNTATQRRRRALRCAQQRIRAALAGTLAPGEFHRRIQAALVEYLADRLNEPPARFLGQSAVTFLQDRGVDQRLVQQWSQLIERCEQAAYAGQADGDTSLADLARRCIQQLERERL